jgi:hypothetical protein
MRAIHSAIDSGELASCKPDGNNPGVHVAYERRHVKGLDLKEWAKKIAPSERPEFLFDDTERATHPTFKTEDINALQASLIASKSRLDLKNIDLLAAQDERNRLAAENLAMAAVIEKMSAPGARAETTYLNIIGGLLELMLGESPAGISHSVFKNQSAIISAMLAYHGDKPGIGGSTLDAKFAEANRSIKGT